MPTGKKKFDIAYFASKKKSICRNRDSTLGLQKDSIFGNTLEKVETDSDRKLQNQES